jgi:hypothetical protein
VAARAAGLVSALISAARIVVARRLLTAHRAHVVVGIRLALALVSGLPAFEELVLARGMVGLVRIASVADAVGVVVLRGDGRAVAGVAVVVRGPAP